MVNHKSMPFNGLLT